MRRYWHPVAAKAELDANPVKAVTLLGEPLVLYRDMGGRWGLLAEACVHRGTSLAWATVEDRGLRCEAHGWLFDEHGQCLDQPMEPAVSIADFGLRNAESTPSQSAIRNPQSAIRNRAYPRSAFTQPAYPVQELGGIVFAYLGPEPRPLLPRYNVLVWNDAVRETNGTMVPCNWLQVMENLVDPLHVEWLHGRYFADVLERKGGEQLQEFLARHYPAHMKKIGFDLFEHGIIERHVIRSEDDLSWEPGTPSFFPTTSLMGSPGRGGSVIFVVPIDDTHTWFLSHMADRTGVPITQESIPFYDVPGLDTTGAFITDTANGQDHMAVVTQGLTARRDVEHLSTSDTGIILYRELLVEQMERCESGQDPMNVRRDPAENQIIEIPRAAGAAGAPDTTGWSRQRRRWAAQHSRDPQVRRPRQPRVAGGDRVLPEGPGVAPVVLREHREVVFC
jgi:5,5'-dehydrodivanillate O-demethylase